jgi:DNA-binding beta-propeller fold protein YncE
MLAFQKFIGLPAHAAGGGFDHGDVHLASGRVFIGHTANGTVEVVDGDGGEFVCTLPDCPEASGVLCAQAPDGPVLAAARGGGWVLALDPLSGQCQRKIEVGPKPNGLAWDPGRRQMLAADVEEHSARLLAPLTGRCLARTQLPGRPRWCVYQPARDRFLVNVVSPPCVAVLSGENAALLGLIDVSAAGPHGLDLDQAGGRAFVACDAGVVVVLDLSGDREVARIPIGGEPDATWYNAACDRLYVAIGQPGLIDVVDCKQLSLAERVSTEAGAHTTAFDSQRQRLYAFLPDRCAAAVYAEVAAGD